MNIDRQSLVVLRAEIEAALAALAVKHKLQIEVGGASFLPGKSVTFKLECAKIGDNGIALTKEAETFKLYATTYGLKPEDLGREFVMNRQKMKIVGCLPRSRCSILCETAEGKQYKVGHDTVKALLSA